MGGEFGEVSMQVPKQVLAAQMPSGAKAVLCALWQAAEDEPPWVAPRQKELADAAGLSIRSIRFWIADLRQRGAIRKEVRELLGRRLEGHGLARSLPPLQRQSSASATAGRGRSPVAKREKPHTSAERVVADLAQIAKHARRSDTLIQICDRLLKVRAPCSEGLWHKVKVFRRIERMATELGIAGRQIRAGEVVERWKKTK